MNDGQDYQEMGLEKTLIRAFTDTTLRPFCYVGIACNEDRMNEYGISGIPDFKNRGKRALSYTKFIIEEFIPFPKGGIQIIR